MLIVTGEVEIAPKDIEDFLVISKVMTAASRAEAECHGYAYYQDIENPCVFRPYEIWTDEAALAFHFATPHMAQFQACLSKLKIIHFDVQKYQRGEVKPLR